MAVKQTDEMKGIQPVLNCDEAGDLTEIVFKVDPAVTPLAAGDFLQLMQVPADHVISDIVVGAPATLGAVTVAVGLADALATTALATTFIAAGTVTNTTPIRANSLVMADTPLAAPTKDQRIVAVAIAAAALAAVFYVKVQYRAARYGR